jgi:hypothetical protein
MSDELTYRDADSMLCGSCNAGEWTDCGGYWCTAYYDASRDCPRGLPATDKAVEDAESAAREAERNRRSAIADAAIALVGWKDTDGMPWWGYIYDGMTRECAVCGASVPGTDETPDVETFAAMRHREGCPAMRLDDAVRGEKR